MLSLTKNILLCQVSDMSHEQLKLMNGPGTIVHNDYNKVRFCGVIFKDWSQMKHESFAKDAILYYAGSLKTLENNKTLARFEANNNIIIVQELSYGFNQNNEYKTIKLNNLPLSFYNVGVYIRTFICNTDVNDNANNDTIFKQLESKHVFQQLTESNKPNTAVRTGTYMSNVNVNNNMVTFNALRCSTNFKGPTENFTKTDQKIIDRANYLAKQHFDNSAKLNHVLAQIYHNKLVAAGGGNNNDDKKTDEKKDKKSSKARIKAHSDKTKDMPRNGLIVFCTFYDQDVANSSDNSEQLSRLRFILKDTKKPFAKSFDVVLEQNSMFAISLQVNALYTHEIVPPKAAANKIKITRMGYVIRCSDVLILHDTNEKQAYIQINDDDKHKADNVRVYDGNSFTKLEKPDEQGIKTLKDLYYAENTCSDIVEYPSFYFSLNEGDYVVPKMTPIPTLMQN